MEREQKAMARMEAIRRRIGQMQGLAAALVIVFAFLAGAFAVPAWAAALAGGAIFLAAYATGDREPERRLGARLGPRRDRRAVAWPDSGMKVIAEGLNDPCIITDGSGIVRYVNQVAAARFGPIQPGDPLSFKLRVTALHDALDRVVSLDQPETIGWAEKIPTERWFEAQLAPIHFPPDPNGSDRKPDFVLVVIEDQTEQRRSERMRADFVANASHELRTPLAALSGFIETLQGPAREDPVARERFLGIMGAQAGRMKRLIDDLLSLSRIEMKAHVLPDTIVDLAELAGQTVDMLAPLAAETGVIVRFERPSAEMPVLGDRDELIQVLSNLIENAIKYGASGKSVEVAARTDGDGYLVAVTDHGPGIAEEHLPRLTERFYRADIQSSREKQGTGLGLAIVKHILTRHRGRLGVSSRIGQGSVFTIRMPSARSVSSKP
ncbi:two-component sensor histidine kinase [Prosthecomicrobium hirschii]|nr:two-component sensor histidine kinase [Prosthecomicrobium hirschii]